MVLIIDVKVTSFQFLNLSQNGHVPPRLRIAHRQRRQYLPVNAEQILVLTRDGRSLQGTMRSYDQFANLVVQDCQENNIQIGNYLIRGENVVLLGEVDLGALEGLEMGNEALGSSNAALESDKVHAIEPKSPEAVDLKEKKRLVRESVLKSLGFSVEHSYDAY